MNLYMLHTNPEELIWHAERNSNKSFLDSELTRIEKKLEHHAGNISNDEFEDLIDSLVLALPEDTVNAIKQDPELSSRLDDIEDGMI